LVSMVNIDFIMANCMKPRANSIKIGVKAWDLHMILLAFHNDLNNTKKYIRWSMYLEPIIDHKLTPTHYGPHFYIRYCSPYNTFCSS
jgi:hypothetical protein